MPQIIQFDGLYTPPQQILSAAMVSVLIIFLKQGLEKSTNGESVELARHLNIPGYIS